MRIALEVSARSRCLAATFSNFAMRASWVCDVVACRLTIDR